MAQARTQRRGGQGGGKGGVPRERNAAGNPKMQIIAEGGTAFTVPYAPREGALEGVAPVWEQIPRGGRKPLLLQSGKQLEQYSFDLIVAHPDPQVHVDDELAALRDLAGSGKRLTVRLDEVTARHSWRLTEFSQQTVSRVHGSNAASRAVVNITLVEVSDAAVNLGPLTGGKSGMSAADRPKFYVWKKGDSLVSVADRFYGHGRKSWHKIADANNIRDSRKIKVGDRLRLP